MYSVSAGDGVFGINPGRSTVSSLDDEAESSTLGLPQLTLNRNDTFATRIQLFFGMPRAARG